MRTKFNIQQLLSPGFSKSIEENSQVLPPPALPVNIFEINVDEYLANNVMDVSTPLQPIDNNMLSAKLARQALGFKVNNNGNYSSTSTTSSNYRSSSSYQSSHDNYKKPSSTNGTSTTKFGFSKH